MAGQGITEEAAGLVEMSTSKNVTNISIDVSAFRTIRGRLRLLCYIAASVVATLLVFALIAASSAHANERIESFSTTTSTTQAGGHPTLETDFTLGEPGAPEAAQNVIFNAPRGVFGNPNAISRCTPSLFAMDECPVSSQAGLMTIRANYDHEQNFLLGTAPIYDMETGSEETARFSFVVPTLDIPISIPVGVRTSSDYGLRFTVAEITQAVPLAGEL